MQLFIFSHVTRHWFKAHTAQYLKEKTVQMWRYKYIYDINSVRVGSKDCFYVYVFFVMGFKDLDIFPFELHVLNEINLCNKPREGISYAYL